MFGKGTLTAVSVAAALAAVGARAEDVYVRSGATGDGSRENPYGELWKAVDRARRGDVIHVAAGTYNGKGGSGHFVIKTPHLTLAGGYNQDFSARNPFQNLTVLERAADYKGDWTGLPESGAIIAGDIHADHGDLTVDGFVLDGRTRNAYQEDGTKILMKKSYNGRLISTSSPNTVIKNCVLANPLGEAVYCTWEGEGNLIENCLIVNWFHVGISTRSAQPGSVVAVRRNTVAFGWPYPSKGGAMAVFVGRQGKTVLEDNIFAFCTTEDDDGGIAVKNTFGNDETVMKNNVFFSCNGGFYKYMDDNRQSLLVWKPSGLADLNDEENCEDYMLSASGGNREADPGLQPDPVYAGLFAGFIGSVPGKLNMDALNQWRRSVGLPLQAEAGSARENFGPPYPIANPAALAALSSKIAGIGFTVDTGFDSYVSAAPAAVPESFAAADFSAFKKGGTYAAGAEGTPVRFQAQMGPRKPTPYLIEAVAPASEY
ncbi:MAG TPA: right-handed parallel beta-helix repeat-containing protein, partial [bacterium]|nr:right-handed parallel beta-helix repeat-containing protein [bacterium]